jgi:hypothetical protein
MSLQGKVITINMQLQHFKYYTLAFKEFEAKSKILSLLLYVELIEIEMCLDNMQLLEVF